MSGEKSGGLLSRIRSSGKDQRQEEEDEGELFARKIVLVEQQVKAVSQQVADATRDSSALKDTLKAYIAEQRQKSQAVENMVTDLVNQIKSGALQSAQPAQPEAEPLPPVEASGPPAEAKSDSPPELPLMPNAPAGAKGRAPQTATALIMSTITTLTKTAHVLNEQVSKDITLHNELVEQQVVISQNLASINGTLEEVKRKLGIKSLPKPEPSKDEKHPRDLLDSLDPEMIELIKELSAETDAEAVAFKKTELRKKIAAKLNEAGAKSE